MRKRIPLDGGPSCSAAAKLSLYDQGVGIEGQSAGTVWRGAAGGVALGLVLMGVFTAMWAGWALAGPTVIGWQLLSAGFWALSVVFVIAGIQLMVVSRRLPADTRGPEQSPGSRIRQRFWLVFAAEGALIGIACGVLGGLGLDEFMPPAVCFIVGAHFLPMAWVFNRRMDLWLGSITILVAIIGLLWVSLDRTEYQNAWTFVGYSTATITSIYGITMLVARRRMLKVSAARAARETQKPRTGVR